MPVLLEAQELTKRYPSVDAVNGVSFSIDAGCCFGLLGPNGAGKTTIVEMLEGILPPSSGLILYRGEALGAQFREEAGIMFQETALQEFITVSEVLDLFQSFYHKSSSRQVLVRDYALDDIIDQETKTLSGGQRQRLLLALALINDPDVLFLDEPTTGLDPHSRRNFWELVHRIKAAGKTVVLTTHYMEEAYDLCDEIVIMDHGKIIAQGSPQALLKRHFNQSVLALPDDDVPDFSGLESGGLSLHRRNGKIEICSDDVDRVIQQLIEHGISLSHLQIRSPTLEDLFLELTGRGLRS